MDRKIKEILKKVAQKHGVSVEEVEREIEIALAMAQWNPDPAAQAVWASIPRKGTRPTTEEVIAHLAKTIKDEME